MIRATFNSAVFLLALLSLLGNAAMADDSLRIARPQRTAPESSPPAGVGPAEKASFEKQCSSANITNGVPLRDYKPGCGTSSCNSSATCGSGLSEGELKNSLPPDGLFARWRAEFVNPTMCPILLCHGSCAGSQMSCKNIKTMIDSLLDAYIPEEPSVQAVLNFRCCAGFADD